MSSLRVLTVANVKSFIRDRAAVFWTLPFRSIFILLFGTIFSSAGDLNYKIGWVDQDHTADFGQAPGDLREHRHLHPRRTARSRTSWRR